MGTAVDMTVSPSVNKTLHSILRNIDNTRYWCSCAICDVKLLTETAPKHNKACDCASKTCDLIRRVTVLVENVT